MAHIDSSKAPTKFFIAGVRRSGTTLIRTTLHSHPDICCIGEAFHFSGRVNKPNGDKGSYQHFLHESSVRRLQDLVVRRKVVENYLDELFRDSNHRAIGLKVMPRHAKKFPVLLPCLRQHGARAIHVVRKNVLKTLISRSVKRASRVAHSTSALTLPQATLRTDKLIKDLEHIEHSNNAWPQLCEGMPYLQVIYEDFVAGTEREIRRMLEFLDVPYQPNVRSTLVKLNSNDIRKVLANYDDVQRVLQGTRFEWCLQA